MFQARWSSSPADTRAGRERPRAGRDGAGEGRDGAREGGEKGRCPQIRVVRRGAEDIQVLRNSCPTSFRRCLSTFEDSFLQSLPPSRDLLLQILLRQEPPALLQEPPVPASSRDSCARSTIVMGLPVSVKLHQATSGLAPASSGDLLLQLLQEFTCSCSSTFRTPATSATSGDF